MKKKTKKTKHQVEQVIIYTAILFILLLTVFNLQNYLGVKKILGASIVNIAQTVGLPNDSSFWEDLVSKNPNYIPGWIELGRMDKVRDIDPNYF